MRITLNGEETDIQERFTIADIVRAHVSAGAAVAVEVNGALCPRAEHEGRVLEPGDTIEIVSFVGGG